MTWGWLHYNYPLTVPVLEVGNVGHPLLVPEAGGEVSVKAVWFKEVTRSLGPIEIGAHLPFQQL